MPKVIYQKEIINKIKQKTGLSRKIARECLSIMKSEMIESLSRGESVNMRSFGSFSLKKTKPRKYYNIHKKEVVELSGKNVVKFKKSKTLVLPMPKIKRNRYVNAMSLKKMVVPYALHKQTLDCDIELIEYYNNIIKDKKDCLPYVWKLKITRPEYLQLKGLLSWALEEYEYEKISSNKFLKKHANIIAIYIAEWYKREYSNNFTDEKNDALKDLGLHGSTQEYNIVWQYSSKAFDIDRFLYKTDKTNRTKHSLYVLGGIPLQFEYKKLRAIILDCFRSNETMISSDETKQEDFEYIEDNTFLLENIYLRESLRQKDGSLHLFVTELKNGKWFNEIQEDEDYKIFIDNYIHFQNNYFCKNKFQNEWLVYYRKGCEFLTRSLKIYLTKEYSAENNTTYISDYRLKQWNVPTENLCDFSIYLKINENCHKQLFQFSYTSDNNYVCYGGNCIEIEDVPVDFSQGNFYLKSMDTGAEYMIHRECVEFSDVKRFFKTSLPYEWTDSPYVKSTEVAILCSTRYDTNEDLKKDVLVLDDGYNQMKYHWFPFSDVIDIIDTLTNERYKFTGKTGRISIDLQQRANGSLENTIYRKSVLVKQENGEYKWVKIYRKEKEIWTDRFVFEEYDQHRGVLISDKLENEEGVCITVVQNGRIFNWTGDLSFLQYGLFKVICKKNNRIATYDAFCINSSADIVRDFNSKTYSFSTELSRGIGGLMPLNPEFKSISDGIFKENLLIDSQEEYSWFINVDDTIRIPVYRVSERTYIVFFNGKAELVNHNKNSSKVILYVPKNRQKDITRINVVDSSGVRGVAIDDVSFIHSLLVNAKYNKDGYFNLYIPDYNEAKYQFVSYNTNELVLKNIKPKQGDGKNQYILPVGSEEIILQIADNENLPDVIFQFNNECSMLAPEWLLGRDVEESIACKRLPDFLYSYSQCKKFNLNAKDYDYLVQLAENLRFNWLLLYPKEWKRLIAQNECMKEILTYLFCKNNSDSIFLHEIIAVVLDGVEGSDNYQWVNHRIGYAKQGIGYRTLEYLMPICVQKAKKKTPIKSVNKRNADKVREVDYDPRNKTIKREKSFTSSLYDNDDAERILEDLTKAEAFTEIYNYMKRLKFVRL